MKKLKVPFVTSALAAAILLNIPIHAKAFSINFSGHDSFHVSDPVHERITRDSLSSVDSRLSPEAVNSIIIGNTNMDRQLDLHKLVGHQHVNSANSSNNVFNQSSDFIVDSVRSAVDLSSGNSRFHNPRMYGYSPSKIASLGVSILGELGPIRVLTSLGLPTTPTEIRSTKVRLPALLPRLFSMGVDPHSFEGRTMTNLIREFERKGSGLPQNLISLKLEFKAHLARQHLGHALHTLQDFAAHSNAIELINNKNGPPCANNIPNRSLCDSAISEPQTLQHNEQLERFVRDFRRHRSISKRSLVRLFGEEKFNRLESGYVKPTRTVLHAKSGYCDVDRVRQGQFNYCHWAHRGIPALNKDTRCTGSNRADCADESHRNFNPAVKLAEYMSKVAIANFMRRSNKLVRLPELSILRNANGEIAVGERHGTESTVELRLSEPAPYDIAFSYYLGKKDNSRTVREGHRTCRDDIDYLPTGRLGYIDKGRAMARITVDICADNTQEAKEIISLNFKNMLFVSGEAQRSYDLVILSDDPVVRKPAISTTGVSQASELIKNAQTKNSSNPHKLTLACSVQRCPQGKIAYKMKTGRCGCK